MVLRWLALRCCRLATGRWSLWPCALLIGLFALACHDSARRSPPADAGVLEASTGHDAQLGTPEEDARSAQSDAQPPDVTDAHAGAVPDAARDPDAAAVPDAASAAATLSFVGTSADTWEGTGAFIVDVALSRAVQETVQVKLALSGTASATTDYQLAQSELALAPGSRSARVSLTIVDDRVIEASETLIITIVGASPAATYTLRLADDDDEKWPTDDAVVVVSSANSLAGANLSGLVYQPAHDTATPVLWLVRNGPSQLYRLVQSGALWTSTTSDGWGQGKALVFPPGGGAPDAESVTLAEYGTPMLYVASERDDLGPSASSVLLYDTSAAGATLKATRAWNLTDDLASLALDANLGPEALTWVPDSYLVGAGFVDEASGKTYDPALYPNHGTGLFLLGIEQNGSIYAYALDHQRGGYTRVAAIESGHPGLMALEFDRDVGYLWAWCDDTCGNQATILRVEDNAASPRKGRFTQRRRLKRPASLPNVNNEGMALAPASECVANKKGVFWVEDSTADNLLRRGSVPCGNFLQQ